MHAIPIILWIIAASYTSFFLVSFIASKKESNVLKGKTGLINPLTGITVKNITGIALLSFPVCFFHVSWTHLLTLPSSGSGTKLSTTITIMVFVCVIALQNAIHETKACRNPNNRSGDTNLFSVISYLLIRIVFLVIYECFFRGLFLSECVRESGNIPAIVINLFLYTGIHVFNDRTEIVASVPFGIALCILTLYWQSVIPAIILHLLLAITYESYILCSFIPSPKIIKS